MEQENFSPEVQSEESQNIFTKVTPLSKYLAMILFVALPFIGGWVGYHCAPEKVVEVERVILKHISDLSDDKQYTWISYSRLLRWQQLNGHSSGSNGLGFSMLIPIVSTPPSDISTLRMDNYNDAGFQSFVFADEGNNGMLGSIDIFIEKDDTTDYTTLEYQKYQNKNGLTYYQYSNNHSNQEESNILIYFPNIDGDKMTLSIGISNIGVNLPKNDITKIIDSVTQTKKFDSGD